MGPVEWLGGEGPGPGCRPSSVGAVAGRRGPPCSLRRGQRGPETPGPAASEANARPGALSQGWERKNLSFLGPCDSEVQRSTVPLSQTPTQTSISGGLEPCVFRTVSPPCSFCPARAHALAGCGGTGREGRGMRAGALALVCSSATVLFMMLSKSNSKKPMEWFIIKQKLALRLRSYSL